MTYSFVIFKKYVLLVMCDNFFSNGVLFVSREQIMLACISVQRLEVTLKGFTNFVHLKI